MAEDVGVGAGADPPGAGTGSTTTVARNGSAAGEPEPVGARATARSAGPSRTAVTLIQDSHVPLSSCGSRRQYDTRSPPLACATRPGSVIDACPGSATSTTPLRGTWTVLPSSAARSTAPASWDEGGAAPGPSTISTAISNRSGPPSRQ